MNHRIADRLVKRPKGKLTLVKKKYRTNDIVQEILKGDQTAWVDTEQFAKTLRFTNLKDLSLQLFELLLNHVNYREDPQGSQVVRHPGFLWSSRTGDCKSFSLFIGSVLRNLGIPYSYRFVSFSDIPVFTHVYVIAHGKYRDVIIDPVYKKFDQEKKYTFKKDYKMEGLYRIEGLKTKTYKKTDLIIRRPIHEMSERDIELEIARQRLEIEKGIVAEKRGIGSQKVADYQATINGINNVIGLVNAGKEAEIEEFIGKLKVKSVAKNFLKASAGITKGFTKAFLKIATLPTRLAAKGILEVWLPKAAPNFLYLFINDKKTLAKLPSKVQSKRKAQQLFADFVVKFIGMKRPHFMGILRNGIMKKYKMSPEKKIEQLMIAKPGDSVMGIGLIDDAITAVGEIVKLISKAMPGKKAATITKDDVPNEKDFEGVESGKKNEIAKELKSKPEAVEPGESIPETGGRKLFGIC